MRVILSAAVVFVILLGVDLVGNSDILLEELGLMANDVNNYVVITSLLRGIAINLLGIRSFEVISEYSQRKIIRLLRIVGNEQGESSF